MPRKRSSPKPAIDPIEFFGSLYHTKGEWAGKPFTLEPWQAEIVRKVFGTLRPDGTRQYRTVYIEVPRKNGKSTLAAGLALYLLYADGEPGAEVYSAAADRDQAAIVFEQAKAMIEGNEQLTEASEVYRRSVVVPSKGRAYKVLSADAPTKHGLNAHGIIFDELHAQPNRDLWDVLTTSTGARRQPLVVAITTAGYDRHSICWQIHDYAIKVRDGIIKDESFLPVIFAADADDDWTSEETWKKANPGIGSTVKLDYLRQECERAKEIPAAQNTFRRLHLNQWTEQADRWIDMAVWDRNVGDVADAVLLGRPVFMGFDAASTTDLTALALLFPLEDGRFALRARFWMPEENVRKRVHRDRVPYDVWIRDGFITTTPGNIVDYDQIRVDIEAEAKKYALRDFAYDRWNVTQLITQLRQQWPEHKDRTGRPQAVDFGQGFQSMTAPMREFEKLLLGAKLAHGNNPVLRWMMSNTTVKQDPAGNLKPDKASSTDRIDGIVASVMALGRSMWRPTGGSVYESRGMLEVSL